MLYMFYVNTGTMMTFDMSLALENVTALQQAVERTCSIPVDKQVLLVSGGLTLDPMVKVCNYGAGTDTNPIFLFTKFAPENIFASFGQSDSDSELNMRERVAAFETMPADYHTLAARSQMAREFSDMAGHEQKLCSQLVDSQHLQQQGWSAVIANLEDSTVALKRHADILKNEAKHYFKSRPVYQDLLINFNEAVEVIDKIPLLPSLVPHSDEEEGEAVPYQLTLLTRFCSEPRNNLEKMAEQCKKWIDQFNEATLSALSREVGEVLKAVEDPGMKEVKGIEDRLYNLNKLMDSARKYANNQLEFAEALNVHHSRVSSTNDLSVLSDLCRTHQMHLNEMLKNHKCLRDIRERCMNAKVELCNSLKMRIKWVSLIQNKMFSLNNKLAIYRENLRRLNDHLDMIHQIHLAPTMYVKTVAEIRRRKNYSTNFLKWASALAEQASALHTKEMNARKAFNESRLENFVNSLFTGMDDFPPPFATERPKDFDTQLPNISSEYTDKLRKQLPELSCLMDSFPDDPMPQASPHKSATTTDSALSTDVPSSQAITCPSISCHSLQGVALFRTETPNFLGAGEGLEPIQDLPSPTSSPFEDPLSTNAEGTTHSTHNKSLAPRNVEDVGLDFKKLHLEGAHDKEMFSPIAEEQNHFESDGDEFERVDSLPKLYEAGDAMDKRSPTVEQKPVVDETETATVAQTIGNVLPVTKDDPPLSPSVDPLKSPDSMMTSHDFHSADYFIDDSMPSSYTESTGASALGKGSQMVKSHHVIMAELQNQIEAKNTSMVKSQSSLHMSHSNILKLQCTLSALQKRVQEAGCQMKLELALLKESILEQRTSMCHEIAAIMEKAKDAIAADQDQARSEQMSAVEDAILNEQRKYKKILDQAQHQVEVNAEKLNDAHREIEMYHEQILKHSGMLDELKTDFNNKLQQVQLECSQKNEEKVRSMVLEHELELESVQEELKKAVQQKDEIIASLNESLSEKQTQLHMLGIEKENIEADLRDKVKQEQELWLENMESEFLEKQKGAVFKALEDQQKLEKLEVERLQKQLEAMKNEAQGKITADEDSSFSESFSEVLEKSEDATKSKTKRKNQETSPKFMKSPKMEENTQQLSLKDEADAKCREEIEMMRSRFKLAYSTTCIEKPSGLMRSPQSERDCMEHQMELLQLYQQKAKDTEENYKLEKERLESEHKAEIERLKACHIAENQVSFNEAISKVVREKDQTIKELKAEMLELKNELETKCAEKSDLPRNVDIEEIPHSSTMTPYEALLQKNEELKKELGHIKRKYSREMYKLKTETSGDNKLSVITCDPGDIVMFCYEEKHANYVAFHFGSVPHFLIPESLELFNLQIPPQGPKSSWTTAVVVKKDYCQARKDSNRFKVPRGSTFYRVKAEPWPMEEALKQAKESRAKAAAPLCFSTMSEKTSDETSKTKPMSTSTI